MSNASDAWIEYRAAVEGLRTRLLALDIAQSRDGEMAAHRLLMQAEALAFNLVVARDTTSPRMLTQTVFLPGTYDWMLPNPDFFYRYLFVDGATTHRLTGSRGISRFLEAQVFGEFFGSPAIKLLETYDFDRFDIGVGQFDVVISATAPGDHARWIRIQPDGLNTLIIREALCDWSSEKPCVMTLEPADAASSPAFDLPTRLQEASRFLDFTIATFGPEFCQATVREYGENTMTLLSTSRDQDAANPNAAYIAGGYSIAPDEALILEFPVPEALYWSIHLGDRWSRTLDYADRQTSLNDAQAEIGPNGRARIILSHRDPGLPNWLDTGGNECGMMLLRWYRAAATPVPEVRIVKFADVVSDTVSVTERALTLRNRKLAVSARYGT